MDDPVQGGEPQGGESTGTFESFLQTVPEDVREHVEPYLKEAEKNVNGRLQEAGEFKKQWEPYQQIEGLPAPEELSEYLTWLQQMQEPDTFREWVAAQAKELGLTPAEEEALVEAEAAGASPEEIRKLVQEEASKMVTPIQEQFETLQNEKEADQETASINQELGRLQKDHGLELSKEQRAMVIDLGLPFAKDAQGNDLPMGDASWVERGLERYREISTTGQKLFLEGKVNQPGSPLSAGGVEKSKPSTDFKVVGEQAKERLRQMQT